jgi:hypothetical protein
MRRLLLGCLLAMASVGCGRGGEAVTTPGPTSTTTPLAPAELCTKQVVQTTRVVVELVRSGGEGELLKMRGQYMTDPIKNDIAAREIAMAVLFFRYPEPPARVEAFWDAVERDSLRLCDQAYPAGRS